MNPIAAIKAEKLLPLPPLIGTVNYDNDRQFLIKSQLTGKVTEVKVKYGDRIKQGDVLAVFSSRDIGEKKGALVDAICSLLLSTETLERQEKLFAQGGLPLATLNASKRQVQADTNAVITAERTLILWDLSPADIEAVKEEAKLIHDLKQTRDAGIEAKKWARVEIKAPWFDPKNPECEFTIVEKNTNLSDMVDPANYGMPLFRVADLSKLKIWVHPPEEYLPILQEQLKAGSLKWTIRFQADSAKAKDVELPVEQIALSLEPNQHTPMLIGYLNNANYTRLVGQFVTATILVKPPEDTVEIPTDAVNPLDGQEFVFVENPDAKDQFLIRRVSVAQSLKKTSYVRTKLTPEQEKANLALKEGQYKIEPLKPGERIVTRGVVELTAALEELRVAARAPKKSGK